MPAISPGSEYDGEIPCFPVAAASAGVQGEDVELSILSP